MTKGVGRCVNHSVNLAFSFSCHNCLVASSCRNKVTERDEGVVNSPLLLQDLVEKTSRAQEGCGGGREASAAIVTPPHC